MPRGSRGEKRPGDVIGAAIMVGRIAIGEESDEKSPKDAAAVSLGRRGGLKGGDARAKSLSAKKRKAIARKASAARWANK
jgi:hypothetical protein